MRATVECNDAGLMNHLAQNRHGTARLINLIQVVVRTRQHGRASRSPVNALLGERTVLRAIGRMEPGIRLRGIDPRLPFWRQRWDSTIWRIEDDRRWNAAADARQLIALIEKQF